MARRERASSICLTYTIEMKIPKIQGLIERRILVNYRVDEEVLKAYLPKPFRPKLVNGKGIAGICLIRLRFIRPKGFPKFLGISSENGAHRIAVEWIENGKIKEGVFIPRRDTSSKLNAMAGGFIFPGIHHLTAFKNKETYGEYEVSFQSQDNTGLYVKAKEANVWNGDSVFSNIDQASAFFEQGSVGYSPYKNKFEGLELKTKTWEVSALDVEQVQSSFFDDEQVFPEGTVVFDNALLMKNIEHEWVELDKLGSDCI